ncbi:hypothetical protein LSO10F_30011 [Candidatus Liberibacter solanacearum]
MICIEIRRKTPLQDGDIRRKKLKGFKLSNDVPLGMEWARKCWNLFFLLCLP